MSDTQTLPGPSAQTAGGSASAPPPAFNQALARLCAIASAEAYDTATLETRLAHALVRPVTYTGKSYILVAFRGTKNIQDWITDARFRRRTIPVRDPATLLEMAQSVAVHEGFDDAAASIYFALKKYIAGLSPASLIVTGHSLGGAIAKRFVYSWNVADFPVYRVLTFGAPRVGNSAWRADYNRYFHDITFRLVNEEDLVPRLPLWLAGNRHAGREIFMPVFGPMAEGIPLSAKLVSDVEGFYRAWRGRKWLCLDEELVDHRMGNYVKRVCA